MLRVFLPMLLLLAALSGAAAAPLQTFDFEADSAADTWVRKTNTAVDLDATAPFEG